MERGLGIGEGGAGCNDERSQFVVLFDCYELIARRSAIACHYVQFAILAKWSGWLLSPFLPRVLGYSRTHFRFEADFVWIVLLSRHAIMLSSVSMDLHSKSLAYEWLDIRKGVCMVY